MSFGYFVMIGCKMGGQQTLKQGEEASSLLFSHIRRHG